MPAIYPWHLTAAASGGYACEEILRTLGEMDFADIEDQGYMPLYRRSKLTDALQEINYYVSFQKLKSL